MVIWENIDIDIDIDMVILENIDIDIDIDKAMLQNIDIDKISNRFKFGISNRATCLPSPLFGQCWRQIPFLHKFLDLLTFCRPPPLR